MINRQAVVLVNPHFLLISVADAQVGNVLLAMNIGTWTESHTAEDSGLERMFTFLSEVELASNGTTDGHWMSGEIQVVLPLLFVRELNPRADGAEVIFDHSETSAEPDDVVMLRDEVEADVILLATVDGQASHHNPRVSLFTADINSSTVTSFVGVVSLDDMSFVNENVGVDVGCVDPFATEVLRQSTARLNNFRFDWSDSHSLRRFLNGLQRVALRSDRHTKVQVIVTILQEASELFIFARFFRVGDSEVMILADEPIA